MQYLPHCEWWVETSLDTVERDLGGHPIRQIPVKIGK
jgi:hypothetical protein